MPCNQIRRMQVAIVPLTENVFDIGQRDKALLDAALLQLGITAYTYSGERLTITTRGRLALNVNQIKVAYSQQVVSAASKRFGWKITKQRLNDQGEPEYEVER
jgi:hypothetical protein